jgi:hypothetical protein
MVLKELTQSAEIEFKIEVFDFENFSQLKFSQINKIQTGLGRRLSFLIKGYFLIFMFIYFLGLRSHTKKTTTKKWSFRHLGVT